jgi:hypothetical protein
MVSAMHARGEELQDSTGKRYIFSYTPSWFELGTSANAVLEELEVNPT